MALHILTAAGSGIGDALPARVQARGDDRLAPADLPIRPGI